MSPRRARVASLSVVGPMVTERQALCFEIMTLPVASECSDPAPGPVCEGVGELRKCGGCRDAGVHI